MEGLLFIWMLSSLVIKGFLGAGLLFGGLTLFNKLNGIKFTDVLERIRQDPRAEADYYGKRAIAVGLVILGVCLGSLL
jgi:hypothetical protein